MALRQNILLSNSNKSLLYDPNNDIQLNFPSNLFFKAPSYVELASFDLQCEVTLFGNTNNTIEIIYNDDTGVERTVKVIVEYSSSIKTDYDLAQAIQDSLNSATYTGITDLVFEVAEATISSTITNPIVETDISTTSYTIKASKMVTISFEHKDSIGMLIGFGSAVYRDVTLISGTSTQSISMYNNIYSSNHSTVSQEYPNYLDVNCKMCMYDSQGQYIPNATDPLDATIAINAGGAEVLYENIGTLLMTIEDAMNVYANSYTPSADFDVVYDYTTSKITITNKTGARFGIGFDIAKETGMQTSGSLHKVLGFESKIYTNNTSFTSPNVSASYNNVFSEDYILICSDLANNSNDMSIIGIGSNNNIKTNNIMFAIPISKVRNFEPNESGLYRINIANSPFAIGYKNRVFSDQNPNMVSFYLRTLSGRHITSTCQWSALMSFIF